MRILYLMKGIWIFIAWKKRKTQFPQIFCRMKLLKLLLIPAIATVFVASLGLLVVIATQLFLHFVYGILFIGTAKNPVNKEDNG